MELMLESAAALIALTLMEIVLGIDNIILIAILTDRLPEEKQDWVRRVGLGIAMVLRIALLMTLTVIMGLEDAVFRLTDLGIAASWLPEAHREAMNAVSWRDIILVVGGLFLLRNSVKEIHEQFHGEDHTQVTKQNTVAAVLTQICIMDIVFSLDSVITAVGMVDADQVNVMIAAIVLAVIVMMLFAGKVSRFVKRNPTIKMLALSFLILIGVMLMAEGAGTHVEKGYIYFAMAFSLMVEFLNLGLRRKQSTPNEAGSHSGTVSDGQ